jgi:hypothetical protein
MQPSLCTSLGDHQLLSDHVLRVCTANAAAAELPALHRLGPQAMTTTATTRTTTTSMATTARVTTRTAIPRTAMTHTATTSTATERRVSRWCLGVHSAAFIARLSRLSVSCGEAGLGQSHTQQGCLQNKSFFSARLLVKLHYRWYWTPVDGTAVVLPCSLQAMTSTAMTNTVSDLDQGLGPVGACVLCVSVLVFCGTTKTINDSLRILLPALPSSLCDM